MNNRLRRKQLEFYKMLLYKVDLNENSKVQNTNDKKDIFQNQLDAFIKYIDKTIHNEHYSEIYIDRKDFAIEYGKYIDSAKDDKNIINMLYSHDLINICLALQKKYINEIKFIPQIVEGYGNTLTIVIENRISIKINSDNELDRNWFLISKNTNSQLQLSKVI